MLIGRAAKILAPDWLNTPFLHWVGFFILCRDNNDFFQVLCLLSKPDCLCQKYLEINDNSALLMGGRSRSISVEEI